MEAMPPKYVIDKRDLMVIRPLSYCKEGDIQIYSDLVKHPIIPCNLCGSQTNLQRKKIKELIKEWELIYPNRKAIIFNSLQNISLSHLLDRNIFDFDKLQPVKDANLFV
jgi:tRNA 2-thiocytidine biosynthesis protein TtcA